jgi:hypothetical protein
VGHEKINDSKWRVWLGRLNSGAKMRVGKKTKKLDGN